MKTESFPKDATVTNDYGYYKTITADDGYTFNAVRGSVNGTPHPVGTKGKIVWRSTNSYGLPFFVKE